MEIIWWRLQSSLNILGNVEGFALIDLRDSKRKCNALRSEQIVALNNERTDVKGFTPFFSSMTVFLLPMYPPPYWKLAAAKNGRFPHLRCNAGYCSECNGKGNVPLEANFPRWLVGPRNASYSTRLVRRCGGGRKWRALAVPEHQRPIASKPCK